ncbi:MAG: hypothetical protein WDO73_12625 [Ignavibacteriota bacterium]
MAWYAETGNHQVCSLRQDGATGKFTTTCYSSDARAILVDRDGSLWLLNLAGCLRVAHPERLQPSSVLGLGGDVEQVTENEGLTSNAAVIDLRGSRVQHVGRVRSWTGPLSAAERLVVSHSRKAEHIADRSHDRGRW